MHSLFLKYLIAGGPFGYLVIFAGMMIEGEGLLFTSSFLTHRGFFDTTYMFAVLFFGALMGDIIWFELGKRWNDEGAPFRFLRKMVDKIAKPLDDHLINRPKYTIFISKFVYGFNHLMLMRAGSLKINLRQIIKANVIATIIWIFVVGGLGYLSSYSFILIRHYLRFVEIALIISLFIFIILWDIIVRRILKKEL
ncbi:VTT domain-containing protein [Candidatus Wolfebacteria bacterium]|nr:VTT domain-containing protein [Candidatus Wolfebacteria bacterium]